MHTGNLFQIARTKDVITSTNKVKTFRGSDPPWINDDIKNIKKLKHKLYHRYLRHKNRNEDFAKLKDLCNEFDDLISKSKIEYYQNINRKLNDPSTSIKTYWSIMKLFSMVRKFL